MPIYESQCTHCGKHFEYVQPISSLHVTPFCCGLATQKHVFTAPRASFDIAPWDSYVSPASGKLITSKDQRREDMRAANCRDWEGLDAEQKHANACKKAEQATLEQEIEQSAIQAWQSLPKNKKDLLLAS